MSKQKIKYTHRYLARIILEAATPLFVGSGITSLINDALVQKDHHGFPMIQGTSLMGVLRHAIEDHSDEEERWNQFFGYQKYQESKVGVGSKVKISSAYLLLPNNQIAEGLALSKSNKDLLENFITLPSRQHVRISDKGVAEENGLFENEVVPKGCRFIFELEVKGDEKSKDNWRLLLNQLNSPLFRLGQGTRNGYGKLTVFSCRQRIFNLGESEDFDDYLEYDPSFNNSNPCLGEPITIDAKEKKENEEDQKFIDYKLTLEPDQSFFIFGSGFGDDEVDNTPLKEDVIKYQSDDLVFEPHSVIPATSIKGAISHRTCFYYNKLAPAPIYADDIKEEEQLLYTGTNNTAVYALFGAKAGSEIEENTGKKTKSKAGKRGIVILDDIHFKDPQEKPKIFNHVAIDRFTGGAIDGALFSEKVSQKDSMEFCVTVQRSYAEDDLIIKSLETALMDICKGLLPLGGITTKGHGIFTGTLSRNNTQIFTYEK